MNIDKNLSFHISKLEPKITSNPNYIFWISMINESKMIMNPSKNKNVLDFGCGDGGLLKIFTEMDYLKKGLGLELDEKLVKRARKNNSEKSIKYKKYKKSILKKYINFFDVVYSQEVIYTIEDLKFHSKEIFKSLKCGGYYFATIGCHIENPLWEKRRKIIRKEEKYYAYDYSIEEIAEIFYKTGFRVGLKRLPLLYFSIYDKKLTKSFSNNLLSLVKTTEEHKMLFCFMKPCKK